MKLAWIYITILALAAISAKSSETLAGESAGHSVHPHHVAIFAGPSSNLEYNHTDLSLGLDYEYRLPFAHHMFGIGLFGEHIFADESENLAGLVIFAHPYKGLKFLVSPGLAFVPLHEEHPAEEVTEKSGFIKTQAEAADSESSTETEFLIRLGVGYDIHTKLFSITPTFNADIINGHVALVYGLSFGIGF